MGSCERTQTLKTKERSISTPDCKRNEHFELRVPYSGNFTDTVQVVRRLIVLFASGIQVMSNVNGPHIDTGYNVQYWSTAPV